MQDIIYKDSIKILELIYEANNYDKEEKKKEIQKQIIAKISILDFYLERAYKKKYINEKQCLKKSNELDIITKLVHGWIKSEG